MPTFSAPIGSFIRAFTKEIESNNAALFAGAGLSMPAGYVDWKGLLRDIIEELELDPNRETDLVSIAQYHTNKHAQNRSRLNQAILTEFGAKAQLTENHRILARLPIQTYWTINYDELIERSLEGAGKIADVKYTIPQLATTRPGRDAIIYKMHGDVNHPYDAVITKDDYEKYHLKRAAFVDALAGDLVSKTFLFIGVSFSDPNLDYVLARIRSRYQEHQRGHYCFARRVSQSEYSAEEYTYRKTKQNHFVADLKRFNINVIEVDQYSEITDILKEIERLVRSRAIFISGSAADYGSWAKSDAEEFVRTLSMELAKRNLKIVSGFGLGIGGLVIAGALEQLYLKESKASKDQLILRPFPQRTDTDVDVDTLWEKYRHEMASYSGIAIFLFGNKATGNTVELAAGVRKEFEICREKGLLPIPIGATEFMARELWEEVLRDFDSIYGDMAKTLRPMYEALGVESTPPAELLGTTLEIVDRLTKR